MRPLLQDVSNIFKQVVLARGSCVKLVTTNGSSNGKAILVTCSRLWLHKWSQVQLGQPQSFHHHSSSFIQIYHLKNPDATGGNHLKAFLVKPSLMWRLAPWTQIRELEWAGWRTVLSEIGLSSVYPKSHHLNIKNEDIMPNCIDDMEHMVSSSSTNAVALQSRLLRSHCMEGLNELRAKSGNSWRSKMKIMVHQWKRKRKLTPRDQVFWFGSIQILFEEKSLATHCSMIFQQALIAPLEVLRVCRTERVRFIAWPLAGCSWKLAAAGNTSPFWGPRDCWCHLFPCQNEAKRCKSLACQPLGTSWNHPKVWWIFWKNDMFRRDKRGQEKLSENHRIRASSPTRAVLGNLHLLAPSWSKLELQSSWTNGVPPSIGKGWRRIQISYQF